MRTRRFGMFAMFAMFFSLLLTGCSSPVCEAGREVECACQGGERGVQVCASDGKRFLPCECAAPARSADAKKEEEQRNKVNDLETSEERDARKKAELQRQLDREIGLALSAARSANATARPAPKACNCQPSDPLCDCL